MRPLQPSDSLLRCGSLRTGRSYNGLNYSNIWANYCCMTTMIPRPWWANLAKARRCWVQVSQVLRSENASPKVCGVFYKATIQAVLLFGSETWNLGPLGMACLEGFHLRAAWQMSGTWPWKRPDSMWKYPNLEKVL
jgi:hypothetical protein